ncbi:hypothetical protein RhoFasGS6_03909 [Rhodococcus fascians]|uniref:hypothetical protein n=1 Tax=Rhodococcoides fascians TaxID=1828 RepID=UPI001427A3A6|nr:hypothetical protein [Rhodococcus fascians]
MLGARLTAATTGLMSITVGGLYLLPEQFVRRPLMPGQINAVQFIEGIGPVWSLLFALAGVLLLRAAVSKRGFVFGHLATAGIWTFYGLAILFSAVLTQPPVPVVAGAIATFVGLTQMTLAIGCAERGQR